MEIMEGIGMQKIAILTEYNRGRNYGQTLQAFALYRTLTGMGYTCELISYGTNTPRWTEEDILALDEDKRSLQRIFNDFCRKHFKFSVNLHNRDEVESYLQANPFDTVVCGSDQIWSPCPRAGLDIVFFMDMDVECRKISYAASMTDISMASKYQEYPQVGPLLKAFDAVSVREKTAKTIVSDLTGGTVEAAVVLDPTLLMTSQEWQRELSIQSHDTPYIFCYMFYLTDKQLRFIEKLAFAKNCRKVIILQPLNEQPLNEMNLLDFSGVEIEEARNVPIEGFLSLIKNAASVVADSFHGTAFSVTFEREIYVVDNLQVEKLVHKENAGFRNIDRMATLLDKAGIKGRILPPGMEDTVEPKSYAPLDYNDIRQKLGLEREKSLQWLSQALKA